jgi:hypothetical protein
MNSTKLDVGNLLTMEILYYCSCLALITKLVSRDWARYCQKKLQYNLYMGLHHLKGPKQDGML